MNLTTLTKNYQRKTLKHSKTFTNIIKKGFGVSKKSYKRFKLLDDESITITVFCVMIIGTIVGGITVNPIILAVVNGSG